MIKVTKVDTLTWFQKGPNYQPSTAVLERLKEVWCVYDQASPSIQSGTGRQPDAGPQESPLWSHVKTVFVKLF